MVLYIKTAKGNEAPIVTQNVTIKETLGSLSTISVVFYDTNSDLLTESKQYSIISDEYTDNAPAYSMVSPFAEIVEKGQHYYLQQPQIDDSTDPVQVTLTGIQIAKQLHWKYVGKTLHGKTKKYTKTEVIKTRVTERKPYKTKKGKTRVKSSSHIVTSTKKIPAKKVEDKITLDKCLAFIFSGTKVHVRFQSDSESLKNKKYSYPDGFGKDYADNLLKKLSQDFNFEYKWDNLTCIIAKKLGTKDSFYFVDRVNCQKINQEENYSNISTRITVYSNPKKTRKNSVHHSKNETRKFKNISHSKKKPKYKVERKKHAVRLKYKRTYKKKVISKTINGKKVSTTKKKSTKATHGVQYKYHYTYTSPLVKSAGYPVIDVKTVYLKANLTMAELKAKAKSLVKDSPAVTYTLTGSNFKAFAKVRGKVAIGNQGLIKMLNGDKVQNGRITAIESHPEDDETADQITFGTLRTDPVTYQQRQERELQRMRDAYADLNNDVFDLSDENIDFRTIIDDNDAMRNHIGNWHVKNYIRIGKNKKKLKAHTKRLNIHAKKIAALEKEYATLASALTTKK